MNEIELHILKKSNDAPSTNRGFLYQYFKTVEKWLDNYILKNNVTIYCETDDDIKLLDLKEKSIEFSQIKCYSSSFNTNSAEVKKAIYNFFILYLKYNNSFNSNFIFESNSNISRNDELLKQWLKEQDNILDSKVLEECINYVRGIINELANHQIESKDRLVNDKIKKSKEKIKNGENVAQSTINIEAYKKELAKISKLKDEINSILCTDEIKRFIKKIHWEFEEKKPTEVIDVMEEKIFSLIKKIPSIKAAPTLMAARLVTEVNKRSSQENDGLRCLDNELLDKIIGESCDEMQSNMDEKIVLYFNKLNDLDERVNAIEVENDKNRYLPFNDETFVDPNNFEYLIRELMSQRSIILSGEPGVGKTSIAEQIIFKIYKDYNIKRIIKISTVNELKRELNKENDCLCFLEDPWGKYKLEDDSNNWSSELKYILPKLREGKYLIVTSRENILKQATVEMLPEVNSRIKNISAEHYDYERKKKILYNSIDDSIIWNREFIRENLDKILNTLTIPFSLVRFGAILKDYSDKKSVSLDDILRKSKIEFFKEEFLKEISCKNDEVKNAGIILWILFATKAKVDDDLIRSVDKYFRKNDNSRKFDLYKLINWMCISKWLNKRNDIYNIHPIVLDALEQYLDKDRLTSADCFDLVLEYYTSFDYNKALEIINHIKRLNFKVPKPVEKSINDYLMEAIVETNGEEFKDVFFQVAKYSTLNNPVTLLIKWLKPDIPHGKMISLAHKSWKKPCWTQTQKESIRQSDESYEITKKFILNIFPSSIIVTILDDGQELFNVFNEFGWDFSEILFDMLHNDYNKFDKEINRIVLGILSGKKKYYDSIILFLIKEIAFLEKYSDENYTEKFRMADQSELDMGEINHLEDIIDDLFEYESALKNVIKLRIKEQGYLWICTYNKVNDIFKFLIDSIEPNIPIQDFKILYSFCPQKDKHIFFNKVKDFNQVDFVDDIKELLSSCNSVELPIIESCINALWHLCRPNEFLDIITELYKRVKFYVFMDIVYYIWKNAGNNYSKDNLSFLDRAEQIIVNNCYFFYKEYIGEAILDKSELYSIDAIIVDKLNDIIEHSQSEIIAFSFSVLCFFHKENHEVLFDMLKRESTYIRDITYKTIASRGSESDLKLIVKYGLKDKAHKCRQYCMEVITQSESKEDIQYILSLCEDPSAMVREKLAFLIGNFAIEEGIIHLIHMLKDTRNKSINYEQPNFHVARVAADSLGLFNTLQPQHIKILIELLNTEFTEDKAVVCKLLNVLAKYPTKETLNIFKKYLTDNWRCVGISDETCPLKYASAWGILNILIEERSIIDEGLIELIGSTVYTTDDRLSEPLFICMCILYKSFSEIFDKVLLNKEITRDKILIFYICNLLEDLGYNEHINKYIMFIMEEPSYAVLKLKENNEEITREKWEVLCLKEPRLKEWITSINTNHSALNLLMRCLLNEEEQSIVELKSDNFRENEICKTIEMFSLYE